jgi:hypothetical protein
MRVAHLQAITVIENKIRLVKRMFAELVLNAARNDKSAYPQVRICPLSRFLPSTSSEHGRASLASADDAGLTQLAYIFGMETELRLEDRLAVFS